MYKIISLPFSSLSECLKIYNDFLENENTLITQALSQNDAGMVALFPVFFKDTVKKLRILTKVNYLPFLIPFKLSLALS